MNYKIYSTFLWILFFIIVVYAQSARIDALGGNFCVDDPSAVSGNPASGMTYTDVVQATAYQDGTFGPVFGVKSIGKFFALGFTANKSDDGQSTFYDDAIEFLDSTLDTNSFLPGQFPPIPHIMAALKLPFMTIGGEVIFEKVKQSSVLIDDEGSKLTSNVEASTIGFYLSSALMFGSVSISPFVEYTIPSVTGSFESSALGSVVNSSTTKNKTLKSGTEIGIYLDEISIAIGGSLFDETYSFLCDTFHQNQIPHYHTRSYGTYCGVTVHPSLNAMLSAAYSYSYSLSQYKVDYRDGASLTKITEKLIDNNHFLVGSCEITHDITAVSIQLFFRTGILFSATSSIWRYDIEEDGRSFNEKVIYPIDIAQVVPTVGFGIQKGIAQFDIASKLAGWSGVVSGMPVVTGTLTLDFKALDRN